MNKEDKKRESINILAQRYRQQSKKQISHEDARRRIIKAITKGE